MSDDLRKWRVYDPLDPLWDFHPAASALDAKTQAQIIILRYRDHHRDGATSLADALTKLAEAIRNIPTVKNKDAAT